MKKYSKIGLFKSKGRIYKESLSKYRTPFQRDRDRIIHSASFRRLKHKTQVFVNTEGDHYRTRLTHSMEVSQIARTLARTLGLNEDLREYGTGAQILRDLGLKKIRLLTNNPRKVVGLDGFGLKITKTVPIEVVPGKDNKRYLQAKKNKLGHKLSLVE